MTKTPAQKEMENLMSNALSETLYNLHELTQLWVKGEAPAENVLEAVETLTEAYRAMEVEAFTEEFTYH